MDIDYRPITPGDVDIVCQQREAMFREMGREENLLDRMRIPFHSWLEPRLVTGIYSGFIGAVNDKPVAGIGITLVDWAPHPRHPETSERGYISNLYVEPAFRRRGLAKDLMEMAETSMRKKGIKLAALHASDAGRALYEKTGWVAAPEMFKSLTTE